MRLAAAGVAGTVLLAAVFVRSGLGDVIPSTMAAAWLVLMPFLSVIQGPPPGDEIRARRVSVYTTSIVVLGAGGLLALWAMSRLPYAGAAGMGPEAARMLPWPPEIAGALVPAALLTAAGVLIAYAFRALSRRFGWQETDAVRAIMPETGREKGVFTVLSATAGFSEEVVFRAWLPAFLMPWTGSYLAGALPVAGVFGFLHAYQGRHGIGRTTAIGVVMAAGVAWTGSLWPSILAHAALDLLFGLVLSKSLLGEPRSFAAREGASWT